MIGGNADCGEPLCCGNRQGQPSSPENAAGPWGDYRSCDMPWHGVLNVMNETTKQVFAQ